jgi:hypothetical protein
MGGVSSLQIFRDPLRQTFYCPLSLPSQKEAIYSLWRQGRESHIDFFTGKPQLLLWDSFHGPNYYSKVAKSPSDLDYS